MSLDEAGSSLIRHHVTFDTDHDFRTVRLSSADQLSDSFGLRHLVFREGIGSYRENIEHPELEYDVHDAHSVHFGTYDQRGDLVATARLVPAKPHPLPILDRCTIQDRYQHIFSDPAQVWEVSRLCRIGPSGHILLGAESGDTRRSLLISASMYMALFQGARSAGASYLVAIMKPSLARLLRLIPVNWIPIGPDVQFFGLRKPYAASVLGISGELQLHNPTLYRELERTGH